MVWPVIVIPTVGEIAADVGIGIASGAAYDGIKEAAAWASGGNSGASAAEAAAQDAGAEAHNAGIAAGQAKDAGQAAQSAAEAAQSAAEAAEAAAQGLSGTLLQLYSIVTGQPFTGNDGTIPANGWPITAQGLADFTTYRQGQNDWEENGTFPDVPILNMYYSGYPVKIANPAYWLPLVNTLNAIDTSGLQDGIDSLTTLVETLRDSPLAYTLDAAGVALYQAEIVSGDAEGAGLIVRRKVAGVWGWALNPLLLTCESPSGDATYDLLALIRDMLAASVLFSQSNGG